MNTTRTTPPPSTPNRSFTAHQLALEAAGAAVALALQLPAPLRSLSDQLLRSASSVPANLAEGAGRAGRDRLHHWRIAYASALEADSHLRLLLRAGAVDGAAAQRALDLFDRVRAMTWRLIHPRR
ncbi:MAG: four helix bundle protein [Acidobacteriota bacterium]|jgi:four helix bundle protein